jgi:hypothetical protein
MIPDMNWGGDSSNRALLKAKDIEMFAKPKPKNTRAEEKPYSPAMIEAGVYAAREHCLGRPRRACEEGLFGDVAGGLNQLFRLCN